jgi:hypothetical protein
VYTHFTYIAGRNNSDTILSVIFIAKESYTSIFRDRPFNLKGGMGKNILIPNVAEKNILILVEEKK